MRVELLTADSKTTCRAAGDLLRAEQNRAGSQYGEMIKEYIREGQIVPMEVTVKVSQSSARASDGD